MYVRNPVVFIVELSENNVMDIDKIFRNKAFNSCHAQ